MILVKYSMYPSSPKVTSDAQAEAIEPPKKINQKERERVVVCVCMNRGRRGGGRGRRGRGEGEGGGGGGGGERERREPARVPNILGDTKSPPGHVEQAKY